MHQTFALDYDLKGSGNIWSGLANDADLRDASQMQNGRNNAQSRGHILPYFSRKLCIQSFFDDHILGVIPSSAAICNFHVHRLGGGQESRANMSEHHGQAIE
jgi:hypothetical protein